MSNHHSGTPAVYCIYFWNWEKWLQSLNDRPTEDERLASKTGASRAFLAAVFTREKTFQSVSCWLGAETTQMQSTATVSRLQWNSTLPGSENALGLTYRNIYLSGRHTFAVADWKCVILCRLSAETPFRGKTRTNQRKLVLDGDEHRRHLAMRRNDRFDRGDVGCRYHYCGNLTIVSQHCRKQRPLLFWPTITIIMIKIITITQCIYTVLLSIL